MKRLLKNVLGRRISFLSEGASGILLSSGSLKKRRNRTEEGQAITASLLAIPVAVLLWAVFVSPAGAAPGSCVQDPSGVVTCTGDQSQGISSGMDFNSPPATTLNVNSLSGPIAPASGKPGIGFQNSGGASVTINSGTAQNGGVITTQGNAASGIVAASQGSPSSYRSIPGLGISVPASASGAGGPVTVQNYSTITTNGDNSHGIAAQNSIGTYDSAVISSLQNFSVNNVTISLASVNGDSANIGKAVSGDNGGLFTLNSNGTYQFDAGTLADTLAAGTSTVTKLAYQVQMTSSSGSTSSEGSIAVVVTKANDGSVTTTPAIYFQDYNVFSNTTGATPLWPNLQGYVNNLLADMGVAGAGESLSLTNHGAITTHGSSSYGIYGKAEGGKGSTGTSGSFWNSGLVPTKGGAGSNGGSISIVHDGSIVTMGGSASGIAAESQGGTGGRGGNGSVWQNGAQGGTGGTGGDISIRGSGTIQTYGDSASGIIAQSAGGAGGSGGSGDIITSGGAGGFGGKGGAVTVDGNWTITTEGEKAHGIWAKSLGGSSGTGGSGGWLAGKPGSGGEASDGGSVSVVSGGAITTLGNESYGIYSQSIGGAGGTGTSGFNLFWSYGGDGGSGGSGGTVSVTNDTGSSIVTQGASSHAIFAQSIGGGGGGGGGSGSLLVSVGGTGGAGGNGAAVSVTNRGEIETFNEKARGIFAQSIGGGGGDSGTSVGVLSVGGSANVASDGGTVTIENTGDIATHGKKAEAIFAESVGGGGGSGSGSVGAISVGGFGKGGGSGGSVTVANSGGVSTEGETSRGIFAQSIGGGGGDGAGSVGLVAVGGSGAGSGNGGSVMVTNSGSIRTKGSFSDGIYAQSVGGGGGTGIGGQIGTLTTGLLSIGGTGVGGGKGSAVDVSNSGLIETWGDYSSGIYAQSVGGGGGSADITGSEIVAIGGSGGNAGNGGAVTATNSGVVTTMGKGSDGIHAQSVGGGGGSTSYNFSLAVNVGGSGGSSGNGGDVTVTNSGEIDTLGDSSHGVFAQSVGGGGGSIHTDDGALNMANATFDVGLLFSLGSKNSSTGQGGKVTVSNTGTIGTQGKASDGIYAQSVGGGGGSGSFIVGAVNLEVDSTVGDKGDGKGGAVTVTNNGTISTQGETSDGIFAQSLGGGGGDGRFSLGLFSLSFASIVGGAGGGDGGLVTVANTGSVTTGGTMSHGILAQSIGGSGGNGTSVLTGSIGLQFSSTTGIGGSGGDGGDGGAVMVTNSGDILTLGDSSDVILAQSVGGGGGTGGTSLTVSGVLSLVKMFNLNKTLSLGGVGGVGGKGGAVDVSNSGSIQTQGAYSRGILAQSVGGGGGTGGNSINFTASVNSSFNNDVGIGGSGGAGGGGGSVTVANSGTIGTSSNHADAILAQSVGGGGGTGGWSLLASEDVKIFLPEVPGVDQIPTLDVTGAVTASIGGSGGQGGNGGNVKASSTGANATIDTQGDYSSGIVAQSVGGGGGTGGTSAYITADISVMSVDIPDDWKKLFGLPSVKGTYSSSIGGSGGSGGTGGAVEVENAGRIETQGVGSKGILAQSVGGGGGAGGTSATYSMAESVASASLKLAPDIEVGYASSVGGSGGSGGSGGNVKVVNSGTIVTEGAAADGILAQSVGGGGGAGGSSISVSSEQNYLNFTSPKIAVTIVESVGGSGNSGGNGGEVQVDNSGSIETRGANSSAVFVQSVGGGGGAGGSSTTTSSAQGVLAESFLNIKIGISSSIGASGGNGGDGGKVKVDNSGSLITLGSGSGAMVAQSVGGGGGTGGNSVKVGTEEGYVTDTPPVVSVGVNSFIGGQGGTGGQGGKVEANNSGLIETWGANSSGILAQSVGGGGGIGGNSINVNSKDGALKALLPKAEIGYSESIGGKGGSGGSGGDVALTNSGSVTTHGDTAQAILAQSVGGGGGAGGSSIGAEIDGTKFEFVPTFKLGISITGSIGGAGSTGGQGGAVDVDNSGTLVTAGNTSAGILAQSVGGGGGTAGNSVRVKVDATRLDVAPTLDIGGEWKQSVGGKGSSGGDGGNVTVNNHGVIYTSGSFSPGILAQSVGGGGGAGGVALDVSADLNNLQNIQDMTLKVKTQTDLVLGGEGGPGGSGGKVTVTNSGNVATEGGFSHGIVVQSVGGGGGVGGFSANMEASVAGRKISDIEECIEKGSLEIKLKGNNGSAGNGGNVAVTNSAGIVTQGNFSYGIAAQSVGGGGGLASILNPYGTNSTSFNSAMHGILVNAEGLGLSFAGSVGGSGSGGSVMVTNSGNITTLGRYSNGIFAQSAGGTGTGGSVTVTNSGNILAEGADSDGILAQSTGGSGSGNITVTNQSGTVQGGSGTGAGVRMVDGAANILTNYGTITSKADAAGNAIISTSGNEIVNNYGTVTGTVNLGTGTNTFNNMTSAVFNSGATVSLGAGNTLTNSGLLSPGGRGAFQTTVLTGNFTQTSSGTFEVQIDRQGNHDKLLINNGSASLDGALSVMRGHGTYRNGTVYDIIETTGGTVSGAFNTIKLPEARPLLSFVVNQKSNAVEVEAIVPSVTTVATNRMGGAIGAYLDRIMPNATGDLAFVLGEFQSLSAHQHDRAFSSMSPGSYNNYTNASNTGIGQYVGTLSQRMGNVRAFALSGDQGGESKPLLLAFANSGADLNQMLMTGQLSQGQGKNGLWINGYGQWGDQQGTSGFTGYGYRLYGGTIGFDVKPREDLMVGLSLGTSRTVIDLDEHLGNGSINNVTGSLYGSYFSKNVYIEGAFSYGRNRYQNRRNLTIGSIEREATSEHSAGAYSGYLGAGYYVYLRDFALIPFGALRYVYLTERGFTESGADSLDLIVNHRGTSSLVSQLGLRLARAFKIQSGTLIPEVRAAWSYDFALDNQVITTSFAGSPGAEFSMRGQKVERCGGIAGAGLTFIHKSGISTSLKYNGEFRNHYYSNGVIGELRYTF